MAEFQLSIKLKDAYTRISTRRFTVSALDYATALTSAAAFIVDYAAISKAQIVSYSLATEVDPSDSVDAGANIDAGLTITALIGGDPNKRGSIKVPAPVSNALNSDGTMNLGSTEVVNFEQNFTSGFVLISDGEVVDDFEKGKLDR